MNAFHSEGNQTGFAVSLNKKGVCMYVQISVYIMYSNITLSKYPCSATSIVLSNIVLHARQPSTHFV
jgi:hypothetical protein